MDNVYPWHFADASQKKKKKRRKIAGSKLSNCCFICALSLTICFITLQNEWVEFDFKLKKTKK